ncbi:cysteine-rich DPF motif domain-containing protein 1 isoform X1 [Ovis canadensis]|uniref:cysteine-rich DPF motif domain-containing protein 1 isoform X1 n=1 Tax=Ovis canadensis TaxID=37174 RepID=UPI0037520F4E
MDGGRRSLWEKIIPELKRPHVPRKMACETERNPLGVFKCQLCALTAPYSYQGQQPPDSQSVVGWAFPPPLPVLQPPGGELRDEGPLHPRQGQIPDRRLEVQHVQQAGVCGPGMQFILLEEILPPLCPGQRGCFPSGNSARLGEKESPLHEACQPAQFSTMSAVWYQGRSGAHPGLVATRASMAQIRDGAEMEPLCRPSLWAVGAMSGAQGAGVCLQQHQSQMPAETAPTGRPQMPTLRDRSLPASQPPP